MTSATKPWCVFGWMPHSIGKVMRDNGSSVELMYCEGQMYPWELWDPKYVRRFDTPEEAVAYLIVHSSDHYYDILRRFAQDFESTRINEHDVDREVEKIEKEKR